MADRISALTTQAKTLRNISLAQIDLAKINQQVSSGNAVASYSELNGAVERVSANQGKLARIDNYVTNNKAITTTLNAMDGSMDQIQKALQDFQSSLTLRRSSTTGDQMNFPSLAKEAMDKIAGALNMDVGGRYVFGGTKTDVPPVSGNISLKQSGVPDDSYYNGNNDTMTARISDSRTINYGVKANDPAFQQAFAAIATAQNANSSNDSAQFDKAIDLVNKAVSNMANVRAKIDTGIASVNSEDDMHSTMKIYWKQAVAGDMDTDVADASIKLSADQTVLQATYQIFALTSKLKLSDYL